MATTPAPTVPFEFARPAAGDGESASADDDAAPAWTLTDEREEVRFELPMVRVLAHTLVLADEDLRERVRAATGVDHTWRFLFATRLGFEPPLPPLTGTASVYGLVRSEAREAFVRDLRGRGVEGIGRVRAERFRTDTRDRVSLTRYRGCYRLEGADGPVEVPVAGAVGVWTHAGDFRLAGGCYPAQSLASLLDGAPETDPTRHRDELVDFVRGTR